MKNVDNKRIKPIVIACRLTIEEYEEFQTWKQHSKIETNSTAIRTALAIAIQGERL